MTNKHLNQFMILSFMVAGTSANALAGQDFYQDQARVIAVTPQLEQVNTPTQECRTEYVQERYYETPQRSNTGAILGGITGGVIGSRFGGGNGRIVTAAVGAGLGAILGDRYDNRSQPVGREQVATRPVQSCVTVDHWQTLARGYLVQYEYNGRRYTTQTDQDPGRYIPVNVSVRPGGYVSDVVYSEAPPAWHGNAGRHNGHRYY